MTESPATHKPSDGLVICVSTSAFDVISIFNFARFRSLTAIAFALTRDVTASTEIIERAKVVCWRTRTFFVRYFMPLNHDSM